MTERKGIVLDANILIRAVFGHRVLYLLETYEEKARFYTPDVCFYEALNYIPLISKQRGLTPDCASLSFRRLAVLSSKSTAAFTNNTNTLLANASLSEIQTTGRSLQ